MSVVRPFWRLCAILLSLGATAGVAQTRIENTASLIYHAGGAEQTVQSNTVALQVARAKRPTTLSFYIPPTDFALAGFYCDTSGATVIAHGADIDAAQLARGSKIENLDILQPAVMVLDNQGGNHDPNVRETSYIDVDAGKRHQRISLLETAPDSGIFAGALPPQQPFAPVVENPCYIQLARGEQLKLSFTEDDFSFSSNVSILIDPAGFVFDPATAALIDGAVISLVDLDGKPAQVFGDDGFSAYPSTVVSGQSVTDASGRVYPAERGRYRFPYTLPGSYVLKVVPPADYTAPSSVPWATLAKLRSPDGQSFILNAASFGGTLTLSTPDPFYADIPIDRAADTGLLLTKVASVRDAAPGDFVQYRLTLTNRGSSAATNLHLLDSLPPGLRYERGSTRGTAEAAVTSDGRQLDLTVAALAPGQSLDIRYVTSVAPGAPPGEALNRARAVGAAASSNEAIAAVRLRPLLFTDALTIIGRVSEGQCGDPAEHRKGVAGIRLLLEDGTFVVTDRDGLYHIEGVRPGRHVVQIDRASVPASHEPVACDVDTRQARNPLSRFVEGDGGVLKRVDFQLRPTGQTAAKADTLPVLGQDEATAAGNGNWLATATPGIAWLFPAVDHNPRAPVLRVVIAHAPSQRVALTVNGAPTDPLAFDGADADAPRGVATSTWTGLPLVEGDNRLVARVLDANGAVVTTLERTVHYAGAPAHVAFDAAHSRLVADGLTRPLIAIRATDAAGRPVRDGTIIPVRVDAPYAAALDAEGQQGRALAGREATAAAARVTGDDGIAFLALQPTTQAGAVRATVTLRDDKRTRTTDLRAWLAPAQKQWVVVGFGSGTLGYDTLRRNQVGLGRTTHDRVVADGQLALYAKGRIKGSWLVTMAYDSARRYDADRGLLGVIDPDRYYTVYGDGSAQGYDAATRRKLYLRLERRELYALFGDFETGLTDTQLGRYSRTLNGLKGAYEGRHVRATGFVADTDSRYGRDEIRGNGLTGPYRLSARDIVPNSDKLRIEVRDRFRSEKILSSTALTRHIDYDLDTQLATVRFRAPVLSRDAALNPIYIVADYEIEGGRSTQRVAAGRVAAKLGRVEVGASAIHDETIGHATVVAADVKARLGATELRGELAAGGRDGLGHGRAFLAEVEHHAAGVDLLAYARQQDATFGVGQQNLVEAGTRKFGLDGRIALTDQLSLSGNVWYQDMLTSPASRMAGEARLEWRRATGTLFAGAQFAADRGVDRDRDSRLLTLGGSQTQGKLTLAGQTQVAPGGDKDSVDFPVRHQLTAAWTFQPGLRLIGGYEIADGADYTAHTAQLGFDVAPWKGAKLTSSVNNQTLGENGDRTYAQYGLAQSLPLGKRWAIDATIDSVDTVRGSIPRGAVVNAFQPVASGSLGGGSLAGTGQSDGDFTALTLGASYRAQRWSWNGRIEYRDADTQNRWGLTTNVLRSLGQGRTLASSFKSYRITDDRGGAAAYAAADLALALRPIDSAWSLLERLELRHESADAGFDGGNALGVQTYAGGDQVTSRIINNVAINYRSGAEGLGHGVEASLYYGAKYVRGRFVGDVYDGFIDVIGFDVRRDLGRRFDLGVAGSVQHAWTRGARAWSGGPSIGVSPITDMWVTLGYNVAGYRDRDFSDDRYTRRGPYLTLRQKFDQISLGRAARALGVGR